MFIFVDFFVILCYIVLCNIVSAEENQVKNKDMLVNAVISALFVTLSCFFARLFSNIAVKLVDLFVALEFISASGVRAVTLTLFSAFFIFYISFKYGYHTASFDKSENALGALLGVIAHFLLSLVTLFSPWVSGGTKHIGGFIAFGDNYTSMEHMRNIPMLTLILIGVVMALVFAGLIIIGTLEGVKKRLRDRAELTKNEE